VHGVISLQWTASSDSGCDSPALVLVRQQGMVWGYDMGSHGYSISVSVQAMFVCKAKQNRANSDLAYWSHRKIQAKDG
jgi:hypothetical protein